MVARWGVIAFPLGEHREQNAGDHKGLVKIPRIFLALPRSTTLAPTDIDGLFVRLMPIGRRSVHETRRLRCAAIKAAYQRPLSLMMRRCVG